MTQYYHSAKTAINSTKLPKTFSFVKNWKKGSVNLDYGSGPYMNVTEFLASKGVVNYRFDPYNLSFNINMFTQNTLRKHPADTATCNNVLNVIDDNDAVEEAVRKCSSMLKPGGTAYFKIYEGDKSGVGKKTKDDCYQRNERTEAYVPVIKKYFTDVTRHSDIIVAVK